MYISYWHELLIVIFRKFDFHLDLMINVYNVQLNACLYFYHTFTNYLSHKFTVTCRAYITDTPNVAKKSRSTVILYAVLCLSYIITCTCILYSLTCFALFCFHFCMFFFML